MDATAPAGILCHAGSGLKPLEKRLRPLRNGPLPRGLLQSTHPATYSKSQLKEPASPRVSSKPKRSKARCSRMPRLAKTTWIPDTMALATSFRNGALFSEVFDHIAENLQPSGLPDFFVASMEEKSAVTTDVKSSTRYWTPPQVELSEHRTSAGNAPPPYTELSSESAVKLLKSFMSWAP